jgi:hypothetical protein
MTGVVAQCAVKRLAHDVVSTLQIPDPAGALRPTDNTAALSRVMPSKIAKSDREHGERRW